MNERRFDGFIKSFSNITIQAVKDIISLKQKVSAKNLMLNEAYVNSLKELMSELNAAPGSTAGLNAASRVEKLEKQTESYKKQRSELLKVNADLEQKIEKIVRFHMSVFVFFHNYLDRNKIEPVKNQLKLFMDAVKNNKDINDLENIYAKLKQDAFSSAISTKSLNSCRPDPAQIGMGESEEKFPIAKAREHFQELIDGLKLKVGEKDLDTLTQIEACIQKIETVDDAFSTDTKLHTIFIDYIERIVSERDETTAFIKEIGKKILEVETQLLDSFVSTNEIYRNNDDFSDLIQGQVENLKRDVHLSESLNDLKSAVVNSLDNIKDSIQKSRIGNKDKKNGVERQMLLLQNNLEAMKKEVQHAKERADILEKEVITDNLTGAYNRRAYEKRLTEEMTRLRRYGQIFSVLIFDVDQFKYINDTYGHAIGDKTLIEIIKRINMMLRASDFLSRYGGDEFIVILPGIDLSAAKETAEKIRGIVENIEFIYKKKHIKITISVGGTMAKPDDEDGEAIFKRFDKALYKAKEAGRNRVVCLAD